jgi:hypothetical protein
VEPEEPVELVADRGELVMIGVGVSGGAVDSRAAALDVERSTSGAEVAATSELMPTDRTAVADKSTLVELGICWLEGDDLATNVVLLGPVGAISVRAASPGRRRHEDARPSELSSRHLEHLQPGRDVDSSPEPRQKMKGWRPRPRKSEWKAWWSTRESESHSGWIVLIVPVGVEVWMPRYKPTKVPI